MGFNLWELNVSRRLRDDMFKIIILYKYCYSLTLNKDPVEQRENESCEDYRDFAKWSLVQP